MARKGFNRNQPRDANGRFASGGGSSGGSRGPVKVGRAGKRGGKVGTRAQQARARREQAARTAQFQSKAQPTAAKTAWKKAQGEARKAARMPATPAQQRAASLRLRADRLRQQGNALMGGSGNRDTAVTNIPLSSRARSNSINAGLRGLELTRRADRLEWRARGIEASDAQSTAKAARNATKPRRARSQASIRVRRAQAIVQRREQKISGTLRQWENSVRTERRALAFLGAKPKPLTGQQAFWRDMVK